MGKLFLNKGAGNRGKGFTLIELLVVIAIIAILAAILFPVLISAKSASKKAKCQSNLKQIVSAALMYSDDYKGWTPAPIYGYLQWGQSLGNGLKGWTEAVSPYMKSKYKTAPKRGENKVFMCPEQIYNYSYGIDWYSDSPNTRGFDIGIVARPTKMIFFFDLRPYWNENENVILSNNTDSGLSNDTQPDAPCYYKMPGKNDTGGAPWWLTWPGVHGGGNNLAFVDGHVKWFKDWDSRKMTFRGDVF